MRYPIPTATLDRPHIHTLEVRKSRFIGWCVAIEHGGDAAELVARARQHYPEASHHCSAYIAGPPGEQQAIGFADDGEPGGTAGRPMYQALAGREIGRIACVVTRYFGGTKLGTGGLARAYSQTVSALLDTLPLQQYVPMQAVTLGVTFADEQPARVWLESYGAEIVTADYHAAGVTLGVHWPYDAPTNLLALDTRLEGRLCYSEDQH